MTTQEKINLIESLIADYQEMEKQQDAMTKLFGITVDSPAMNPFWKCFDRATGAVMKLVGDDSDWINWYIFENRCGAKAWKAGRAKKMQPITNVKQLVKLIEAK